MISDKYTKVIFVLTVVGLFMIVLNVACTPEPKYIKTGMLTGYSGNYIPVAIEDTNHLKNNEGNLAKGTGQDIKAQLLTAQLATLLKKHERILAAKEDLIASERSLWFP